MVDDARRQGNNSLSRPDRLRAIARLQPLFSDRVLPALQDNHRPARHLLPRRLPHVSCRHRRATFTWKEFESVAKSPCGRDGAAAADRSCLRGRKREHDGQSKSLEPGKSFRSISTGAGVNYSLRKWRTPTRHQPPPARRGEAWCSSVRLTGLPAANLVSAGRLFRFKPRISSVCITSVRRGRVRRRAEMESWWSMPFEKSGCPRSAQHGQAALSGATHAKASTHTWSEAPMHFHAKWRAETLKSRPFSDWTYCDLKGKGVFVGDMLSLTNPVTAWWGEGDEKILRRRRIVSRVGSAPAAKTITATPGAIRSRFSTRTTIKRSATGRAPAAARASIGSTSSTRSRSLRRSNSTWNSGTGRRTSTCLTPPPAIGTPGRARPTISRSRRSVALQTVPPPTAYRIQGGLEGESLRIAAKSGDFDVGPQDMSPFGDGQWSGASHLLGAARQGR